jgi:hypothetical protein
VQVSTDASMNASGPAIGRLKDGSQVIAWYEDNGTVGSPFPVCFQRYSSAWTPLGANVCISGAQSPSLSVGVVASDDGGFAITWNEDGTAQASGARYQRFDAAGQAVGGIQSGSPAPVKGAHLSGGGYVALVTQPNGDTSSLSFQLYAADGTPTGTPVAVASSVVGSSQVVAVNGGGFAIAWQDAAIGLVTSRLFSADRTPVGDAQTMDTTFGGMQPNGCATRATCSDWENVIGMTAMDDGGYVVAWLDGTRAGIEIGPFVRRMHADGTAGAAIGRLPDNRGSLTGAALSAAGADAFAVAWNQGDAPGRSQVFVQRVDVTALR